MYSIIIIILVWPITRTIMIIISVRVAIIPASIVIIIISKNGIDDPYGDASCQDTEHVKHDSADAATQGHAIEGLSCALLFSRVA